jgi:ATP synthase protein I
MKDKIKHVLFGKKDSRREFFRFLGVASTVGINLVISTFVGFALGYFVLDRIFNTFPWFTLIFLILGIIAGFRYLFKVASRISNNK